MSASSTAEHGEKGETPVERYAVLREGKKVATVSAIGYGDDLKFKVNAQTAEFSEPLAPPRVEDHPSCLALVCSPTHELTPSKEWTRQLGFVSSTTPTPLAADRGRFAGHS